MALPNGVSACTVTFGPYLDQAGRPLQGSVTFVPSSDLTFNGAQLLRGPVVVKLANGQGSVVLPHTDQEGMTAGGFEIINWTYTAVIRFKSEVPGEMDIRPFSFSLPQELGDTWDLDTAVPIESVPGELIPTLVTAAQLAEAVAPAVSAAQSALSAANAVANALPTKVDKVAGKVLSDNNYSTADKSKLGGISDGATVNAPDSQLRDRGTHTGTQDISTVAGLQALLDSKVVSVSGKGLSTNDYTTADKDAVAGLPATVGSIQSDLAAKAAAIEAKFDKASTVATSLRDKGATGVATQDATQAIRDALALVSKGSGVPAVAIDIPPGTYRITDTILIDRIAPRFAGAGAGNPTNHANPGKGTTFIWDGPANVPMFRVRDCQNFVMQDLLMLGNDARPPSELIFFENDGSSGQVGTNQGFTFHRVSMGRYGYAGNTYAGYSKVTRCIRFGGTNVNNDQAYFYDCQFGGASDALVAFDNSNTLWCSFINPLFDGRSMSDDTTPTATGIRTAACTVLINPQFNRCAKDIDATNGTTYVYMWNSENSAQFASIGNSAGLVAHGGAMVAHSATMGANMFDATAFGTDGELSLTDIRFRTAMPMWPKIKVRGSSSTLPGRLVVRDCGLPADVYDVQAHATGSGGVVVKIDDGDLFMRRHLLAGASLGTPQPGPFRVGGYLNDGSALNELLGQLSASGLIAPTAQTSRATRTNALLNPRFASANTGWTKSANVTATTVGSTVEILLNTAVTAGNSLIYNTTAPAAVAGEAWSAGMTVKMTGNTTRQRLRLQVNSYASGAIRGSQTVEFAPGETKRMCVDGALVATGDTSVRLVLVPIDSALPAGVTVTLSDPVLEKAPVTGVPFTGASTISGWTAAWSGTADNSASTLTDAGADLGLVNVTVPTPTASGQATPKSYVDSVVSRPSTDKVVYVSTSGTDSNSGRALGLPFLTVDAAIASFGAVNGGTVMIAAGTYSVGDLTVRSGRSIIGAGRNATVLNYTGTGTAITSSIPGTRTYGVRLDGFTLQTSTGAVGIDLASISNAAIYECNVNGFSDACVRLSSSINGGCVYNNLYGVTAIGTGAAGSSIAFDVPGSGSNSNTFHGCSGRSSAYGLKIVNSNHVTWIGGTIEANAVGVSVESTTSSLSDNFIINSARFEGNTVANWKIGDTSGTNVRSPWILFPALVTSPGGDVEGADRMHKFTNNGIKDASAAVASAAGTWRFERTANGGTEMPAFVVSDPVTSTGTPVTIQAETGRGGGFPFRAMRAGLVYWDVDGAGNVRQPQGSYHEMKERASDPVSPAADNLRLYARDNGSGATQMAVKFSSGAVAVLATDGVAQLTQSGIDTQLATKVDKVTGKGLSTEDYTSAEKTKLAGAAVLSGASFTGPVVVPTPTASGHATTKAYVDSAAVGNPGGWVPADNGLLACDADPLISTSSYTLATAGVVYLRKIKMAVTSVVSNVLLNVNTAGAGLANSYVGLYDASGNQLGVSADQSTSFQATGTKTIALTTPTASIAAGTWVYVAILVGTATTLPNFRAFAQAVHLFGITSVANYRWVWSGTGQSALPSSFTPSAVSSVTGPAPMVGLT